MTHHLKWQLLVSLVILAGLSLCAQPKLEWSFNYGGTGFEEITAIVQAPGGGFLAVGHTSSSASGSISEPNSGSTDILAVRMSRSGVKLWEKLIGSTDEDRAFGVIVDDLGRFIITGHSRGGISGTKTSPNDGPGSFAPDVYVICLDQAGNSIWQTSIGGNGLHTSKQVIQLDNGNYLIAAETNAVPSMWGQRALPLTSGADPANARFDYWLIELDTDGNFVREHLYGGDNNDRIWGMRMLQDRTIVVFGASESGISGVKTHPNVGLNDMWIVHIDQDGTLLTDYQFGGTEIEVPFFLTQFSNGDLFVSGQSTSPPSGNKTSPALGELDLWCVRFQQGTGTIVWDRTFGGSEIDDAYTGRINVNDYVVLAGTTRSTVRGDSVSTIEGRDDGWVIYVSPQGDLVWDITRGGDGSDNIRALIRSEDGGWYLGGESNSSPFSWRDVNAGGPYGDLSNGIRSNDGWLAKLECDLNLDLGLDTLELCSGEEFTLRNTLSLNLPNTTYRWSDGTTDSVYTGTASVDEFVILQNVSPDACEASDTAFIKASPVPEFTELSVVDESCAGATDGSLFVEVSTDAIDYSINGQTFLAPTLLDNLAAGEFDIQVNSAVAKCSIDSTIVLQAGTSFSLDLGADQEMSFGEVVSLNPNPSTSDSLLYQWSGLPGLCVTCNTQSFVLTESGTVSVTVTDLNGCEQTAEIFLRGTKDRKIGIPNAISPNNDGSNDRFGIFPSPFVESMGPLQIFDRWGNLMFTGVGDQLTIENGWDGTFRGKPVQSGVYVYILPVRFFDGEEQIFQGEINVLR